MISFKYHPKFAGYLALNRHVYWKTFRMFVFFGVLGILAYLASPLAQQVITGGWSQVNWGETAIHALLVLLPIPVIIGLLYFGVWKAWNRSEELRSGRDYEVGEEGIRVSGASFDGFLGWRYFDYAEESGEYFFLKTTQRAYHYFPVSAVPDRSEFVALLKDKIPKTKTKD